MKCVDADSLVKALIEARDKEAAEGRDWMYLDVNSIIEVIENSPAVDVASVVRCKDCESYNNHFSQKGFGWCEEEAMRIVNDNFYCGNAIKRERVEKDG